MQNNFLFTFIDHGSFAYNVINDYDNIYIKYGLTDSLFFETNIIDTDFYIYSDFDDFLDLVAIADDLLIAQAYEGVYQLASFHPDYCFAEASPDDAANYTNRSPYPILHLIREASIEQVLNHYPEPENIPLRNIALTRELGSNYLQALLNACHQSKPES